MIQSHHRNKITIAKDETRIKLNSSDNDRIFRFAEYVDKLVRQYTKIHATLRGEVEEKDGILKVTLHSSKKPQKSIFQILENSIEPIEMNDISIYRGKTDA